MKTTSDTWLVRWPYLLQRIRLIYLLRATSLYPHSTHLGVPGHPHRGSWRRRCPQNTPSAGHSMACRDESYHHCPPCTTHSPEHQNNHWNTVDNNTEVNNHSVIIQQLILCLTQTKSCSGFNFVMTVVILQQPSTEAHSLLLFGTTRWHCPAQIKHKYWHAWPSWQIHVCCVCFCKNTSCIDLFIVPVKGHFTCTDVSVLTC